MVVHIGVRGPGHIARVEASVEPAGPTPANREFIMVSDSRSDSAVTSINSTGTTGWTYTASVASIQGWLQQALGYRIRFPFDSNFGIGAGNSVQMVGLGAGPALFSTKRQAVGSTTIAPYVGGAGVATTGAWWRGKAAGDSPASGSDNKGLTGSVNPTDLANHRGVAQHFAANVLLWIGINDSAADRAAGRVYGNVKAFIQQLNLETDALGKPRKVVWLFNEVPPATSSGGADFKSYAEALRQLAWNSGHADSVANVRLIETFNLTYDAAQAPNVVAKYGYQRILSESGGHVHPSPMGFRRISEYAASVIGAVIDDSVGYAKLPFESPGEFVQSNTQFNDWSVAGARNPSGSGSWIAAPDTAQIPRYWTLSSGSASALDVVAAKTTLTVDGVVRDALELTINTTIPASGNVDLNLTQSLASLTGFDYGGKYQFVAYVKLHAGAKRLVAIRPYLFLRNTGNNAMCVERAALDKPLGGANALYLDRIRLMPGMTLATSRIRPGTRSLRGGSPQTSLIFSSPKESPRAPTPRCSRP